MAQRKHAQFSSGGLLVRILTLPFFQGVEISAENRVADDRVADNRILSVVHCTSSNNQPDLGNVIRLRESRAGACSGRPTEQLILSTSS